jgi:uncharacterized membrane protein YkoI
MRTTIRKTAAAVGALGALGLGGAALAGAAQNSGTATPTPRSEHQQLSADVAAKVKAAALAKVPGATVLRTEAGGPDGAAYHAHIKTSAGKLQVVLLDSSFNVTAVKTDQGRGHGGPGGRHGDESPLAGDTKSKVEAAVLAKYPGATIVRTETNSDGSAPYESHIKTSDGKELEVHVSKDFAVVNATEHPAHP